MSNELNERPQQQTGLVSVEQQRAIAETQAAMMLARANPRDEKRALDRILTACQRESLAQKALYCYSRGGSEITGPSIRMAEAIAQNWGNLQFGIRELEQRNGESVVEAFAWDVETNTRQVKTFTVRHERHTKKGSYALTDPRDIYEMTANQGARRLRACILGIVPGDIVDAAAEECEKTLHSKVKLTPERILAMVAGFEKFKVTKAKIEARIQRRMESITPAQFVSLGKIYNSIQDGMSKAADWFPDENMKPPVEMPQEKAPKGGKITKEREPDEDLSNHPDADLWEAPETAPEAES